MPALSPTMTKGRIVKWHKNIGDNIESGELLLEVETDKAVMEVESVDDGIIGYIVQDQHDYEVNKVICIIKEEKDEDISEYTGQFPEKILKKEEKSERIRISPIAKKIAEENNIDYSNIKGSGPDNRIVKIDIEQKLEARDEIKEEKIKQVKEIYKEQNISDQFTVIKQSRVQEISKERLSLSKQTIPHFYISQDINVSALMNLREELRKYNISLNSILLKLIAHAAFNKIVNSHYINNEIRQYHDVNIGFAVNTDIGILVPVIEKAQNKTLSQISSEANDLINKAKENKLTYQMSTITISNMGMTGIKSFNAIINPPETAILAIGSCIDNIMNITGSFDHRVIDGMQGAAFMNSIKSNIENPLNVFI